MKAIRVRHSVTWSMKLSFGWFVRSINRWFSMKLRTNMAWEIILEGLFLESF